MHGSPAIRGLQSAGVCLLFAILCTANAAGYRYGVSDQAFYIPVVVRALEPAAYPRDAALIDAQGRLMLADEALATIVQTTGVSLETLFFVAYLASLALTWLALRAIGARVYTSGWGTMALLAVFTLRHRIPRTSANSFEPYFHPRMLAFAICLLAVGAVLRRQTWLAIALVGVSAVVHVTTALWFSVMIGVALAWLDVRLRRVAITLTAVALIASAWIFTVGPLRTRMDDVWLQAVASKDSLFATDWPLWAWVANLALLAVLWFAHRRRTTRGDATAEERALVWGATALVALFLVTLPLVHAHIAFVVQLQISRIFWLVDIVATIYLLSLVRDAKVMRAVAVSLIAVSVARGAYVMLVERADRGLIAFGLPDSPWTDAMRWVGTQPLDAQVLADPGHAWKYGTSVRVAARRDVVFEEVKDSAIAIYSRDVAVRVVERTPLLNDFARLTPQRAHALADRYHATLLVTEGTLDLPLAYQNRQFRIYRLRAE